MHTIPHGRPNRSWENNFKVDLREIACEVVDWILMSQDRSSGWSCDYGTEPSYSVGERNFLHLSKNHLINENLAKSSLLGSVHVAETSQMLI
jgi:hypothetical protein